MKIYTYINYCCLIFCTLKQHTILKNQQYNNRCIYMTQRADYIKDYYGLNAKYLRYMQIINKRL